MLPSQPYKMPLFPFTHLWCSHASNLQSQHTCSLPFFFFFHYEVSQSLPAFESLPNANDGWLLCKFWVNGFCLFSCGWSSFISTVFLEVLLRYSLHCPSPRTSASGHVRYLQRFPVHCRLWLVKSTPVWEVSARFELHSLCSEFSAIYFSFAPDFYYSSHLFASLVQSDHSFSFLLFFHFLLCCQNYCLSQNKNHRVKHRHTSHRPVDQVNLLDWWVCGS